MDGYRDHRRRVGEAHDLRCLRSVVPNGAYSQQKCVAGVRALARQQLGKWRTEAHVRYREQGPKRPGPGRHKT